jgi:hypothetical protein
MNIQEVIEHMGPEPVCASNTRTILRGMGIDPDRWIRRYLSQHRNSASEAAVQRTSRQRHGIHSVPDDDGRRLWVHRPDPSL